MNQIISNAQAVFAALTFIAMGAQAFPIGINKTIDNPCGRDLSANGSQTYLPLVQEIQLSLGAFREMNRKTTSTMTAYLTQNLLTQNEVTMLSGPLRHLQDLPSRQSSDYSELVPKLRQDYHDISVFLVYLQHSQTQQFAYDGNLMGTELHEVNQALYTVLCRMDTLLRQRGTTPTEYVESSVIPSVVQNMRESKERYHRDFLLLKDIKAYVEATEGDYEDLFGRLSMESA